MAERLVEGSRVGGRRKDQAGSHGTEEKTSWPSHTVMSNANNNLLSLVIREAVGCKHKESQTLYLAFGLNLLDKALEYEAVEW